jgi:hypothetical protein
VSRAPHARFRPRTPFLGPKTKSESKREVTNLRERETTLPSWRCAPGAAIVFLRHRVTGRKRVAFTRVAPAVGAAAPIDTPPRGIARSRVATRSSDADRHRSSDGRRQQPTARAASADPKKCKPISLPSGAPFSPGEFSSLFCSLFGHRECQFVWFPLRLLLFCLRNCRVTFSNSNEAWGVKRRKFPYLVFGVGVFFF